MTILLALTAMLAGCAWSQVPSEWSFNSGSQQVWHQDSLLYENYLGKRSVEFNANFTAESQFRICSNTKLFSAVSIMQLVERQVISSVHDNIADYLDASDLAAWGLDSTKPFCPTIINSTVCQNITFVSLLSMSSGIIPAVVCDFQPDQWQYKYCLSLNQQLVYPGSIAQTIALFIGSPLQFAPGPTYGPDPDSPNTYQYANENFVVLSYFIQKLSKMSLQDYFQAHIFDVVGLHSTTFDPFSQAFATIKEPTSEYFYYTDLTQSDEPFAMGSCTSVEVCSPCICCSCCHAAQVNPGLQAGSGGIISTVPDMVKWYTSLFITRNTSVIGDDSLALILYPWSLQPMAPSAPTQFYGFGIELIFEDPPTAPPSSYTPPIGIYYSGGSMCTFLSIAMWNGTTDLFTGQPLKTLPVVAVAARNNRILNVTQEAWSTAQQQSDGSWAALTSFPTGWGAAEAALTDTLLIALQQAFYFAAQSLPQFSNND